MSKEEQTIKRNCFNSALQLIFKYDDPTDDQVYRHLCRHSNCPTKECTYMFGFKEGKNCIHVGSVKKIIKRIVDLRNGE